MKKYFFILVAILLFKFSSAQICINPQNNVGISQDNPVNAKLDIFNNTISKSIYNQQSYSGTDEKTGIYNNVTNHGNNVKVGISNYVAQDSNNGAYSIFNNLASNGGNGSLTGTSNGITNYSGSKSYMYGTSNNLSIQAYVQYPHANSNGISIESDAGTAYGTRNSISINGPYSVDAKGLQNQLIDYDTGAGGNRNGFINQIVTEGNNGGVYGIQNIIETRGNNNSKYVIGMQSDISCETNGNKTGISNSIENISSSGSIKGINNNVISNSGASDVRGINSTINKNHNGNAHGILSSMIITNSNNNTGNNYGLYNVIYKDDGYDKQNEHIYGVYSLVSENFTGAAGTEFYSGFFKGQDVYIQKRLYVGGEFMSHWGEGNTVGQVDDIDNPLEKLNQLKPKSYIDSGNELRYCFNDKEIQKVFPELTKLVSNPENPKEKKEVAIDYNSLIPVLVAAINEQSAEIEMLKEELRKRDMVDEVNLSSNIKD